MGKKLLATVRIVGGIAANLAWSFSAQASQSVQPYPPPPIHHEENVGITEILVFGVLLAAILFAFGYSVGKNVGMKDGLREGRRPPS